MRLTFVGKDPRSNPTGSPTVYHTDAGSLLVQGWVIADPGVRAQLHIPDGEDAVEIPDRMLGYFLQVVIEILQRAPVDQEGREQRERRGNDTVGVGA